MNYSTKPIPKAKNLPRNRGIGAIMSIVLAVFLVASIDTGPLAAAASKIKIIVNGEPITTYDIARRAAFLKLRRTKGNRTKIATEELVDEAIKMQAAKRVGIKVGQKEVDTAYAGFAKNNKMPVKALTQILNRSGVTSRGFKKFVRAQMTWQRLLAAKARAEGQQSSSQNFLAQLRSKGGEKPSTTEYTLQQVIFVVPKAKRRALMAKRRREARAFRNRFESCANTITFAKGLRDVTVRKLGRVMQQQLPPDWKKYIIATREGKTTKIRDTQRGVEFIAVCRSRTISDDSVALINFQIDQAKKGPPEAGKKYLEELKKAASIIRR